MRRMFIYLLLVVLSVVVYPMDIISHYSDREEAGISLEQRIVRCSNLEMGLGFQWNELVNSDRARTFPTYINGRFFLRDDKYGVMRAGATLDDNYNYDSKFLETGIGIIIDGFRLESTITHSRGRNQLVLKMGYALF